MGLFDTIRNTISRVVHAGGSNSGSSGGRTGLGGTDSAGNFVSPNGATGEVRARQAATYYSSIGDQAKLAAVKNYAAKNGWNNIDAVSNVMNRGSNTDTYLGQINSPTRSNQSPTGNIINPTGIGNFVYVGVNGAITPVGPVQGKQMQQNAIAQGYDPTVGGRLIEVTKDNLVSLPGGQLGVHHNGVVYGYGSDASTAYGGYTSGYKPMSTSIMKEGTTLSGQQVTNSGLSPWGASKPGDAFNQSLQGSWQIDPYGGYQRINDAEAMKNAYYNVNVNDKGLAPKSWDQMLQEIQKMNSDPYAIASNQQNMMKGNAVINTAANNQADVVQSTITPTVNTSTYGSNAGGGTIAGATPVTSANAAATNLYTSKTPIRNYLNDGGFINGVAPKAGSDAKLSAITARVTSSDPSKLLEKQQFAGQLSKNKKTGWS